MNRRTAIRRLTLGALAMPRAACAQPAQKVCRIGILGLSPTTSAMTGHQENSGWRRFWHVTVPVLRPFLALALFLSLTGAFWDLTNVWSLTGGRVAFPVITTQAYWLAVFGAQFGPAAALSLTLVPPLLVVLIVLFRLFDAPVRARA